MADLEKMAAEWADKELRAGNYLWPESDVELGEIVAMLTAFASHVEQSAWVSVKERLPEEIGVYLTYGSSSPCGAMHASTFEMRRGRLDFSGPVTHWRPLPEAPRG